MSFLYASDGLLSSVFSLASLEFHSFVSVFCNQASMHRSFHPCCIDTSPTVAPFAADRKSSCTMSTVTPSPSPLYAYTQGWNSYGQVGEGTTTRAIPTPVAVMDGAVFAAVGYDQTCAVSVTGELRCWGGDEFGELGKRPGVAFLHLRPHTCVSASLPFILFLDVNICASTPSLIS